MSLLDAIRQHSTTESLPEAKRYVDAVLAGQPVKLGFATAEAAERFSSVAAEPGTITCEIILYWSDEDQAYIAEVPELEWCAADGATYQEAIANVEIVIDEWIETAKEKGWKIPQPKGRRLLYA